MFILSSFNFLERIKENRIGITKLILSLENIFS